jgi:hypothetical protein
MLRPSLFAVALAAAPAALAARGTPAAQQQPPARAEMQQIQARLQGIQARALQDAALRAAQDSIGTEMTATMERLDPTFKAQAARIKSFQERIVARMTETDPETQTLLARRQELRGAAAPAQQPRE